MPSWIFQGNPKIYDLTAAVRALKEETWLVQQHRAEIRVGDRVYLWESGPEAGIVAVAEVLDEVSDRPFGESGKLVATTRLWCRGYLGLSMIILRRITG